MHDNSIVASKHINTTQIVSNKVIHTIGPSFLTITGSKYKFTYILVIYIPRDCLPTNDKVLQRHL